MAKEEILIDLKIDESDSVQSINSLRAANKELTKERNNVNLATAEGAARVKALNAEIDKNNNVIKSNVDSLQKQRLTIGDYKAQIQAAIPQLDQFSGGLASTSQGFLSATKSALAFIATPIGAVITALGLAVGALITYFKGSDEAQDKLAEGSAILGVAMDGLRVIVEKVGQVIFKTFEFLNAGVKAFIDFAIPSMGAALDQIILQGKLIAKLQDDLENTENENLIKRAAIEQKVAKLRQDAITQEGQTKRNTIEEAIRLEKQLSDISVDEAKRRLGVFLAETKAKGELTGEENRKKAELIAAVIRAETEQFEATLKFEKQLESLRDKENAQLQKNLEKAKEINAEKERAKLKEITDLQTFIDKSLEADKIRDEKLKSEIAAIKAVINEQEDADAYLDEADKKAIQRGRDSNAKKVQDTKFTEEQRVRLVAASAGQFSNILGKQTAEGKALASVQAGVDTYAGANAQLKLPFPFNLIAAATTIATGLFNIAKINGFAGGGRIGSGFGIPISRSNGDNVLATVKTGEVILNERQQSALGGSRTFRAIGVPGFADGGVVGFPSSSIDIGSSSFMDFSRIQQLIQSQPIVVTVEDINKGLTRVAQIEDRATF